MNRKLKKYLIAGFLVVTLVMFSISAFFLDQSNGTSDEARKWFLASLLCMFVSTTLAFCSGMSDLQILANEIPDDEETNGAADKELVRRLVAAHSEGNASLYMGNYITQETLDSTRQEVLGHNFKQRK